MIGWLLVICLLIGLALVFTAIVLMIAGIYKKFKGTDTSLIMKYVETCPSGGDS